MRGTLALDLSVATVLALTLAASSMALLYLRATAMQQGDAVATVVLDAYFKSNILVGRCSKDGGVALCRDGFLYQNRLDGSLPSGCRAREAIDGVPAILCGPPALALNDGSNRACARRLGLMGDRLAVLEVCVEA